MSRLFHYFGQFHRIIWVLLIGTVLARGSAFMTLPFLAIYLSELNLHPVMIGLTIGMSPLMATIGGFIGGNLSDRFGRKPIMLTALFGTALVYYGFTIGQSQIWFVVLNSMLGLCSSFFEPVSQALMADLTTNETRKKVYSLRYTAINIGASTGPLLGAYLAISNAKLAFVISGTIYLIYALILTVNMKDYVQISTGQAPVTMKSAFQVIRKDKFFRNMVIGIIFVHAAYSQLLSSVPKHFDESIENGLYIYSVLLTLNAVMVVFLQLPISHFIEKYKPMNVLIAGSLFFTVGLLIFGFANGWISAVAAIVIFTLGEILSFPSNSILIDELAEDHLKGTYFGAAMFRKLGDFAGPIIGGYFLSQIGGYIFSVMSLSCLLGIVFFVRVNRTATTAKAAQKVNL